MPFDSSKLIRWPYILNHNVECQADEFGFHYILTSPTFMNKTAMELSATALINALHEQDLVDRNELTTFQEKIDALEDACFVCTMEELLAAVKCLRVQIDAMQHPLKTNVYANLDLLRHTHVMWCNLTLQIEALIKRGAREQRYE